MATRISAADRAERIMSIVPWLVVPGGVSIAETCERFQISPEDLRKDLDLLFYNVGVHPFTPDALVDVFIDEEEDSIEVNLNDFFRRPLRLTPDEALAIIGSARVVLASGQGTDVLASAVARIEDVLSAGASVVGVELAVIDPTVFRTVRGGLNDGKVVEIQYHSFARDEVSTRRVEGQRLFSAEGRWYLRAWCLLAGGHRVFRLDRTLTATITDDPVDPERIDTAIEDTFEFSDDSIPVRLLLREDDSWVPAQYPTESVEELPDGRLEVLLDVSALPWLARLLLRVDPTTEVFDANTGVSLAEVRRAAASQILTRYT